MYACDCESSRKEKDHNKKSNVVICGKKISGPISARQAQQWVMFIKKMKEFKNNSHKKFHQMIE